MNYREAGGGHRGAFYFRRANFLASFHVSSTNELKINRLISELFESILKFRKIIHPGMWMGDTKRNDSILAMVGEIIEDSGRSRAHPANHNISKLVVIISRPEKLRISYISFFLIAHPVNLFLYKFASSKNRDLSTRCRGNIFITTKVFPFSLGGGGGAGGTSPTLVRSEERNRSNPKFESKRSLVPKASPSISSCLVFLNARNLRKTVVERRGSKQLYDTSHLQNCNRKRSTSPTTATLRLNNVSNQLLQLCNLPLKSFVVAPYRFPCASTNRIPPSSELKSF